MFFIQKDLGAIAICFALLSQTKADNGVDFEFGRKVKNSYPQQPIDLKLNYRNLLETEIMLQMSMSMSMSMSMGYDVPSPDIVETKGPGSNISPSLPPSPPPASAAISPNEGNNTLLPDCDEQSQGVVSITLEVETAIDNENFYDILEEAIQESLEEEFKFCSDSRVSFRSLEGGVFLLGNIKVAADPNESCSPQNQEGNECLVVTVNVPVSSDDKVEAEEKIQASIESALENDKGFGDDLSKSGIVRIRVVSDSYSETAAMSGSTKSKDESQSSGGNAAVIVLSVAGTAVLAGVVWRRVLFGKDDTGATKDYQSFSDESNSDESNEEMFDVSIASTPSVV